MPMLVLREIKEIVNGYDTVRLRSFTVSIRYKTPDRIVFVKLEKTVLITQYMAVKNPFLPGLWSVFGL